MDVAKVMDSVLARFIGTKHERDIKKLQPIVAQINALEPEIQRLSDDELKTRFTSLKAEVIERLKDADPAETQLQGFAASRTWVRYCSSFCSRP